MKMNRKIYFILVILSSIACLSMVILYFLHWVGIDIVMVFLGINQLIVGLNQINLVKQQKDSGRITKVSNGVGIFSIILGLGIIGAVVIKMIS